MAAEINPPAGDTYDSRWLCGFSSPATRRGYRQDMEKFVRFLAAENNINRPATLDAFLASNAADASRTVAEWLGEQRRRGLASETINRACTALRSFLKFALANDVPAPRIAVKQERVHAYRDTAGCGLDGFRQLLAAARQHENERKQARDVVILILLFLHGLRRAEVVALDIGDFNPRTATLNVLAKGRSEPERLFLCDEAVTAIGQWLTHRGSLNPRAALFVGFRRGSVTGRLTGDGLYKLIRRDLGGKAGVVARPHGLRHAAITAALDEFAGDYREVRRFSRHASLATIERYDDNRHRQTGAVSRKLAKIALS